MKQEKKLILKVCHHPVFHYNYGIMRYRIEKLGFYWEKVKPDIEDFIDNCFSCQKVKHLSSPVSMKFKKIWKEQF